MARKNSDENNGCAYYLAFVCIMMLVYVIGWIVIGLGCLITGWEPSEKLQAWLLFGAPLIAFVLVWKNARFFRQDDESDNPLQSSMDSQKSSNYNRTVPTHVRDEVWRRDEGKCATCGSRERLEYDHIIPVSKGGSNTARNIELLCEQCNRSKSDKIQ